MMKSLRRKWRSRTLEQDTSKGFARGSGKLMSRLSGLLFSAEVPAALKAVHQVVNTAVLEQVMGQETIKVRSPLLFGTPIELCSSGVD